MACVDPLDFISFMSWVSQETLGAIVTIGGPPPFEPLDKIFPLKKSYIMQLFNLQLYAINCDY
jgi:hypothetical protein